MLLNLDVDDDPVCSKGSYGFWRGKHTNEVFSKWRDSDSNRPGGEYEGSDKCKGVTRVFIRETGTYKAYD